MGKVLGSVGGRLEFSCEADDKSIEREKSSLCSQNTCIADAKTG